jgi:hypothetical protein
MNPEITTYIDALSMDWQKVLCTQLRAIIHSAIPEATEKIQYGKPHFFKNKKYIAVLGPAKGWVSFTLFNATNVEAPDGTFEPSDITERRTIKFKSGQQPDAALLTKMIAVAAASL